jgi:hypothetical protein
MHTVIFADGPGGVNTVVKVLAVLGGAFICGALVRFFTGALVRMLTTRPMPMWARRVVGVTGAVAGGWLIAILMSWGGSGSGWWPFGGEPGSPNTSQGPPGSGKGPGSTPATTPVPPPTQPSARPLRIEILGDKALAKIPGASADPDRCYRIDGPEGKLLTLAEVQELIRQQIEQQPPLRRITLVRYKDTPADARPWVKDLADWARDKQVTRDEKLQVDWEKVDGYAPMK